MPLMMPYGMMPYPAAAMLAGHAQAFPHMQPHTAAPTGLQQAPRHNNGFAGACAPPVLAPAYVQVNLLGLHLLEKTAAEARCA